MKDDKKTYSRKLFICLLTFFGMAVFFSVFRVPISDAVNWCLALTGEIKLRPPKDKETEKIEIEKQRMQQANTISKTKVAPKTTTTQTKKAPRTTPAKEGFYYEEGETLSVEKALKLNEKAQVVYNPNLWTGPEDCSALAWVAKGKSGIYVTVEVTDDKLWAKSDSPWQNDCVELYLDFRAKDKRGAETYDKGAIKCIALPEFAKNANSIHFYNTPEVPGTVVKSQTLDKGYRIQVFFPYSGLKKNHLLPSDEFNFDFGINDIDDGNQANTMQMMWSGTAGNSEYGTKYFGRLKKNPSGK